MPMYDVPQTDSTTEPAMAALVARLRASAPKPEAITLGAASDATIALLCARWVDRIGAALGDRATPPLIQWDASLDGACIALASRDYYNTRGRERKGQDSTIDAVADEALAYVARLRPSGGPDGKTENPRFVDSAGTVRDAPGIKSSATADDWIARRYGRATR